MRDPFAFASFFVLFFGLISRTPAQTNPFPATNQWTLRYIGSNAPTWYQPWMLSVSDGKYLAGMSVSDDGLNWRAMANPTDVRFWVNNTGYGAGTYIVTGAAGDVWNGVNETNWTKRSSPIGEDLTSICYGNQTFVARGYWTRGLLMVSTNRGTNWASVDTGDFNKFPGTDGRHYNNLRHTNGFFFYPLYDSVRTSTNGFSWTTTTISNRPADFRLDSAGYFDQGAYLGAHQTSSNATTKTVTTGFSSNGTQWSFNTATINSTHAGKFWITGAAAGYVMIYAAQPSELWISPDRGVSWSRAYGPWDYLTNNLHAAFVASPSNLLVATTAAIYSAPLNPGLEPLGTIEPGPAGLSPIDFADKIAFDSGTLVTHQRPATLNGYPLTDGGRIQIFTSSNSVLGSGPWSFRQTLTQPDANYDTPSFGWGLGVWSNAIFASSSHTYRVGAHDGTGYIFSRSNSSANFTLLERWAEIPAQWAGYFSQISSMRSGLMIVSQGFNPSHNSYGGAFFYSVSPSGARTKIHSFMESSFDKGCHSAAIASNTAAVFMYSTSTNHQIRIFGISRDSQGVPSGITTNQILVPVLGGGSEALRESMDLSEDLLAVGRLNAGTNGFTNSGAVDLYLKGTNGQFSRSSTLLPPSPANGGGFGSTVAVVGRTLLVGSPGVTKDATNAAGAVYVYSIQTNGAASLVATNRIPISATYANEIFGSSIFRQGNAVAIGTSGGLAQNGISGRILMYQVVNSDSVPSTGTAPVFTSTNSLSGTVGVAFSNTVTASGTAPITFRGTNLPAGLTLATNGLISGTPTAAGTNSATLTASNAFGTTNQSATFVIARGTPTISNWPTASPITYGQALSNSVLTGGAANVSGNFAWTVPTNRPNAGINSASVTFTPAATNNYVSVSTNLSVVVAKATNNIIFGALPIKYVGDAAFNLTATASSGLPVTYASSNPNVATVLGDLVTIIGEGTTTITASQTGDGNWSAASPVTQTLRVDPAINRGLVAYYPLKDNLQNVLYPVWENVTGINSFEFRTDPVMERSVHITGSGHMESTGGYLSVSTPPSLRQADWTIAFWIKDEGFSSWHGEGYLTTASSDDQGSGSITILGNFWREPSQPDSWGDVAGLHFASTLSTPYAISRIEEPYSSILNIWRHYIISKSSGQTRLWIDGQLRATLPEGVQLKEKILFGKHWWDGGGAVSTRLIGRVRNLYLYDRTFTGADSQALYTREAIGLDTDGDGLSDAWERGYGRYQIVNGRPTWEQARQDAISRGGHLATITSQQEWSFIWANLGPAWGSVGPTWTTVYWIGGTDADQEGNWRWLTGETWNYSRWCAEQPSGGAEHYLTTWYPIADGMPGWNDGATTLAGETGGYLLEFGYPTDPTKADTDGDGVNDKLESTAGTDPNNSAVYPVYTKLALGGQANASLAGLEFPYTGFAYGEAVMLGDFPFTIPGSGNNIWHPAVIAATGTQTLTLTMNVGKIQGFATLINTYWGRVGTPYASLTFNFSDGTSHVKNLVGNLDIRDYNNNNVIFTRFINGTTTVKAWPDGPGNVPLLDRQYVNLAAAGHGGKTLTSVVLTDHGPNYNSGPNGQRVFLAGATAVSSSPFDVSPIITSTNSFQGKVGVSSNWTVTASGSVPIRFSASNLPTGLTIATNGVIRGTPTVVGTNQTVMIASNSVGLTRQTNTFVIAKGDQTITFGSLATKYLDEGSFTLGGTASSGLALSYTSANTNVATVSGNTVTLRGAGTTVITASQTGNSNWNAATNVTQTLAVQARDTDGDGVTDVMEVADGTQTNNASSFNPLSKGLVAYYPFNGNANDASGNGNHSIPQGNTTFISNGLSGGAFRPIGDGSQYYAGGGHALLPTFGTNLNAGFTLSLWVRDEIKGPAPAADIEQYISFGAADLTVLAITPHAEHLIYGMNNTSAGTSAEFRLATNMASFFNSGWKHLVLSYRPGEFSCYLNGRRLYQTNASVNVFPVTLAALNRHWWSNGGASSARMTCTYENVRIYDRVLSASEVSQLISQEGIGLLPVITSTNSFAGTVGVALSNTVSASGTAPITFRATNLPAGLGISSSNGLISGVPTVAGSGTAAVTASNSFGVASVSLAWTVLPGAGTISLSSLAHSYDGTGKSVGVVVSPTNATYTVTYDGTTNLPVVPGNYEVVGTLTGSHAGSVTNNLVIAPKVLSVSNVVGVSRRYDGTVEVGVNLSGASLAGVVGSDRVSLVGITASGSLLGGAQPGLGKLVVVEGLMLAGEESGYYELGPVVTAVDILPRGLEIRAKDKGKAYGEAVPTLEWELADPASLMMGHTLLVELATAAVAASGAGEYEITVGMVGVRDAGGNDVTGLYDVSRVDGKLTVHRAVPAFTWAPIGSFGYGTALGTAHLNATSPVAGSWSYHPGSGTVLAAGVLQEVVATFVPQDTNNQTGLVVTNRVTVTRAKVVIRAISEEIEVGMAPALDYEVLGLVNGESQAGVTAGILGTDPVFNATVPGIYRIVQGTVGVGGNYELERFEEGVLRVKAGAGVADGSVTPLAGGFNHSLLLRTNGGVSVWGVTNNGEAQIPAGLGNVAGVAAGASAQFSLAWRKDGGAVGWGSNSAVIDTNFLGSLSNVVGMAGGDNHGLALFRQGTVQAWGSNGAGQTNVPGLLGATNAGGFVRAVAVSAAQNYSLALRADGTVRMWGQQPTGLTTDAVGALSQVVGLAAGSDFVLSLHADGSVRYTGNRGGSFANERSQVPASLTNPASVATNPAVAVAAGIAHGLAVRRDGSVLAWGDNQAATGVPAGLTNAVAVAGGQLHSLILLRDGAVVGVGNNANAIAPGDRPGAVPQGGPDSDGDGWSNEAELRAGSHPLNNQSVPAKVVLAGGGTNGAVRENGSLLVDNLKGLDRMGWVESLENLGGVRVLGPDGQRFEVVGQQLRLKAGVDYEGLSQSQGTANPELKVTLEIQGLTQELVISVENDPADDGDTVPPVITLLGDNPMRVNWQGSYSDPGARVTDNVDAERTITGTGTVNTARPGNYTLTYEAQDQAGNRATNTRTVRVQLAGPGDTNLPPSADGIAPIVMYALQGGGAQGIARSNLPQTMLGPDKKLRITAVVRTNDSDLSVAAWASGSMLGPWTNLGVGLSSADQTGVDRSQFERREYEAGGTNQPKVFLRLVYTHHAP